MTVGMVARMPQGLVESSLPGRVRLRVPRGQRHRGIEEDIEVLLENTEGVREVTINDGTGSILMVYDPDELDAEKLGEIERALDDMTSVNEEVAASHRQAYRQVSRTARSITRAFDRADSFVNTLTQGVLDARTLAPILLLLLALSRAFYSSGRTPTPWYTLLWYSYSMFMHYHGPPKTADLG